MKTKKSARDRPGKSDISAARTQEQGIWSGTVSFSLVAIPVRLVRAVETGRVSFHLLHNKDYSPLVRKMFCPEEQLIVPAGEIIRGFEIEPGKNIMITKEELESVSPDRSRTIEIVEFVDINEIDPLYYDHPYFLIPLKGGEKAYRLLVEAMQRTNRAGIAKFVLDEREYLVAVKCRDGALALSTLHYNDEILPEAGATPGHSGEGADKNDMKNRIKKMIAGFSPEKYANDRRSKILAILAKKNKEKTHVEAPQIEEEATEGMTDLMAALEAGMKKAGKKNR